MLIFSQGFIQDRVLAGRGKRLIEGGLGSFPGKIVGMVI